MAKAVDELVAREVAHATERDIRTVRRVMRGEHVRGLAGTRIRAELAKRQLLPNTQTQEDMTTTQIVQLINERKPQ